MPTAVDTTTYTDTALSIDQRDTLDRELRRIHARSVTVAYTLNAQMLSVDEHVPAMRACADLVEEITEAIRAIAEVFEDADRQKASAS